MKAQSFSYATMTPAGIYGSTVQAPDLDAAIKEAERIGYEVLDVTTMLRDDSKKGNPEGWVLVIADGA